MLSGGPVLAGPSCAGAARTAAGARLAPRRARLIALGFVALGLVALGLAGAALIAVPVSSPPRLAPDRDWAPGGRATVSLAPYPSSLRPAPSLPRRGRPRFHAGKALANQPWVKAPTTTTARDGLGPLYNARSCLACHVNGGRGHLPQGEDLVRASVLRLSLPANTQYQRAGVRAHPVYGEQIQGQSVALADQLGVSPAALGPGAELEARAEAKVSLRWRERRYTYPDGATVNLRSPRPVLSRLAYGPLGDEVLFSLRHAPAIHGAGLIALIPEAAILARADPADRDGDGLSGRANRVWSRSQRAWVLGRFGWKANLPDLEHTVAGAFARDLGISNPLFPEGPCTAAQERCRRMATGAGDDGFELSAALLQLVVDFTANLGVPAARPRSAEGHAAGAALFEEVGCAGCHTPSYVTGPSARYAHLGAQRIWPYSDFLLHDMGEALADARADYRASGREWRTAPLWGAGLAAETNGAAHYLHDGRAASLEEAVLWHGGEAAPARAAFAHLDAPRRGLLLAFVGSL